MWLNIPNDRSNSMMIRTLRSHGRFLAAAAVSALTVATACTAHAQFNANKVKLYSQLDLGQLGVSSGNDCWGYTSPSGREYVIMGTATKTIFIEITDPVNPVIIHSQTHANSFTADMKVYQHYCYTIGDRYSMQILDMSNIDNGVVTLAATKSFSTHNIALNEDSGFAYLCASNINSGITALDLSDPLNPTVAGSTNPTGNHVHDAQIITYTTGQYAGREIAFCPSGQSGFDIIDMTDKSNMVRLSHTVYTGLNYSHQCWIDDNHQYVYLNDELDELNGDTPTTRTLVFDVSDLSNPFLASTFTSGTPSTDHNLYIRNGFLYEANYKSGLRLFDISKNPTDPPQVGWFDTYPANDNTGFSGAWSVYPFYDSGTIIVSDIDRGLFVLDVSEARGERMDLVVSPLVAGQNVTLDVDGAIPGQRVYFTYSLTGEGWTSVNVLGVYLEILNPILAGKRKADGSGHVAIGGKVPGNWQGKSIWIQAAESGNTSILVEDVVQ